MMPGAHMDHHTAGLGMDHHVHTDMRAMYHHAKMAASAHGYDPTKMAAAGHHHPSHYDANMMCMGVRGMRGDAAPSILHHLPNMTMGGYPYHGYDLQTVAAHASTHSEMREDKWAAVQ